MKYAIKDLVTAQLYCNLSMDDVTTMLKVSKSTITKSFTEDKLIKNRFKVIREVGDVENKNKFPLELLNEWDRVCRRFRVHYGQMEVTK